MEHKTELHSTIKLQLSFEVEGDYFTSIRRLSRSEQNQYSKVFFATILTIKALAKIIQLFKILMATQSKKYFKENILEIGM